MSLRNPPHFVIIGAMKSATSTLYKQLEAQPGIFFCTPKEPNFFSNDEIYAQGLSWYDSLFSAASPTDLRGEASTHYTKLPTYPATVTRMKASIPDARLIYVMRHPIDRLVSHFMHEWSMGIYHCDIEEAVTRYPELKTYSSYAEQLMPFINHWGLDNILPVFFDRLLKEPQSELEIIAHFIGYTGPVKWLDDMKAENVSSERIRRFAGDQLLLRNPLATWLRRHLVPQGLRDKIKDHFRMQQRPQLRPETRAMLAQEFDRDLAQLGSWLNTDITCENFRHVTASSRLDWKKP